MRKYDLGRVIHRGCVSGGFRSLKGSLGLLRHEGVDGKEAEAGEEQLPGATS
jgi:hypothetical protein